MVAARAHENDVRASTVVAAMRLFAAHGFEGTALQDIADAVGVSKPAVLHHFPSKEHVRQAVLDEILSHWNEALPRLLLAASGSGDRFDAVFGELYRFFSDNPDRARVVAREMLDRPGELAKLLRGSVKPWLGAVAGYIRAGKERGLHYADVDEEAYLIHVLLLVITATASADVTSSALETASRARHDRYDRELARIARASLFSPIPTPKKAASEARKRKATR
jgi:AcrR family transcriptional regulator